MCWSGFSKACLLCPHFLTYLPRVLQGTLQMRLYSVWPFKFSFSTPMEYGREPGIPEGQMLYPKTEWCPLLCKDPQWAGRRSSQCPPSPQVSWCEVEAWKLNEEEDRPKTTFQNACKLESGTSGSIRPEPQSRHQVGQQRVIRYGSRTSAPVSFAHCSWCLGGLCVGCEKFRDYLYYAQHFTIYMDNNQMNEHASM